MRWINKPGNFTLALVTVFVTLFAAGVMLYMNRNPTTHQSSQMMESVRHRPMQTFPAAK